MVVSRQMPVGLSDFIYSYVPPPKSSVEVQHLCEPSLRQNKNVFGDRAFEEVTNVNWRHMGGPYSRKTDVLTRIVRFAQRCEWMEKRMNSQLPERQAGRSQKKPILMSPCPWTSGSQVHQKINVSCLSLWYFVMTVLEN